MHWADAMAQRLADISDHHIIATGITPSGPIHVGNMREVLTAELVHRACQDIGLDAELIYVADDADPLRKVYPFLDQETYTPYVGHMLAEIPAPEGSGTYAEHFLAPFLTALEELDIHPRVVNNRQSYLNGLHHDATRRLCEGARDVQEILENVSGRDVPDGWFPWTVRREDGVLGGVEVTEWSWPEVEYRMEDGTVGVANIEKAEGKLPWRLDWPARWGWLDITFEPCGKDHFSAGSSYDTGRAIAEWLGQRPPDSMMYEWIYLRGEGAMSSSTGNLVDTQELLRFIPPENLRFLVARNRPKRHIDFDLSDLLTLADEYERTAQRWLAELEANPDILPSKGGAKRADEHRRYELSRISGLTDSPAAAIGSAHLAMVVQLKSTTEEVKHALAATHGLDLTELSGMDRRIERMRAYVESDHLPDAARLRVRTMDDPIAKEHHQVMRTLHRIWSELDHWEAEVLQNTVPEVVKAADVTPKQVYTAAYTALLGRESGPRLGSLAAALGRRVTLDLLNRD